MGIYSENPNVNDTVLTVISDGSGTQCGFTYKQRLELARQGLNLHKFREMARNYGHYRKVYEAPRLTRAEWVEAGNILAEYYAEHVKECAP